MKIAHQEPSHVHHRSQFKPFFRKIWWWNILIDVVLTMGNIYLLYAFQDGEDFHEIRLLMILWIASMLHLLYLLCIFIIHAFKKPRFIAGFLFLHMGAITVLMYVFYIRYMELTLIE